MLANNSITHTKKTQVIKTDDKDDESSKSTATQKKKKSFKRVEKKSFKILISIFGLIYQPFLNM